MAERLIVVGAATPTIIRVLDDVNQAQDGRYDLLGFVDNAFAEGAPDFHGHRILGGFDAVRAHDPAKVVLINTIMGSIPLRVSTTEYFLERGYRFATIVHPSVNIKYVTMGAGCLVYESAMIHPFVQIGEHCVISSCSGIAHDAVIGNYCFIGPASYICGWVQLKDRVYVGTGANILPRLEIGAAATIGAGSLVNKPVEGGQRILGVPGRAS